MSGGASRWAVPLAAAGLIGAVWVSLEFAPDAGEASGGPTVVTLPPPGDVPGFRSASAYLPDDERLGFVEVPAGPFIMGSDAAADPLAFDIERWSPSAPLGSVDLPTFWIGRYEVTVAQFAAFVRDTGYGGVEVATLRRPPDHPVAGVAWTDAVAYADWLQERLLARPDTPEELASLLRDGWSVSLPTEAQWEKAARGVDGRIFPWGDAPRPDRANYRARGTAPVGSYACPECPHGLADMAGNVWELTRSPYQPYPYSEADDRQDPLAEALFIMRGGGFSDGEQNVRAAVRGGVDPGARRPEIGFRVVIGRF